MCILYMHKTPILLNVLLITFLRCQLLQDAAVLHTEIAAHANCGAMCKLNTHHITTNNDV